MLNRFFKNITSLTVLLSILTIFPIVTYARTESVSNEEDLKRAISDTDVDTIVLNSNIDTTEKITISRPIYIDGKGHTIKYTGTFKGGKDNTVWDGKYVLQIYRTNATIKDIKLTGGNAGLLVNGSTVTLRGEIDVSGNGFGGVELAQGENVTEKVKLSLVDDAELVNTTDSDSKPTLWVPSDSDDAKLEIDGKTINIESGKELEIKEINQLAGNPETSDPIYLYIILNIVGILSLIISFKKLKNIKGLN